MIQAPLGFVAGLISDHLSAICFCIIRKIKGVQKESAELCLSNAVL